MLQGLPCIVAPTVSTLLHRPDEVLPDEAEVNLASMLPSRGRMRAHAIGSIALERSEGKSPPTPFTRVRQ